jgi:GTP-binding protein HflX
LPHHLIASFKATLEEAIHADLLLHIVDVSTEHAPADVEAVLTVLAEIRCADKPQILVLNKADLVKDPLHLDLAHRAFPGAVATSAKTGEGLDRLAGIVTERLVGPEKEMTVRASPRDGRLLAWIDRHAEVMERHLADGELVQRIRMPERLVAEIQGLAAHRVEVTTDGGKAARRSIRRDEETPR